MEGLDGSSNRCRSFHLERPYVHKGIEGRKVDNRTPTAVFLGDQENAAVETRSTGLKYPFHRSFVYQSLNDLWKTRMTRRKLNGRAGERWFLNKGNHVTLSNQAQNPLILSDFLPFLGKMQETCSHRNVGSWGRRRQKGRVPRAGSSRDHPWEPRVSLKTLRPSSCCPYGSMP